MGLSIYMRWSELVSPCSSPLSTMISPKKKKCKRQPKENLEGVKKKAQWFGMLGLEQQHGVGAPYMPSTQKVIQSWHVPISSLAQKIVQTHFSLRLNKNLPTTPGKPITRGKGYECESH